MKQCTKQINNHSVMILFFMLCFISLACIKLKVFEKEQKEVDPPKHVWNTK